MQWHRGWHRRKWFCLGTTSSIKHIPHLPHGLSGLLEAQSLRWSLTCVWRKQSVTKCNDKTDIPQATAKLLHAELRASFLLLKKGTPLRKCKPRLWAWQVSYEIWNFLPESTLSWKNSTRIPIQTIRIQAPGRQSRQNMTSRLGVSLANVYLLNNAVARASFRDLAQISPKEVSNWHQDLVLKLALGGRRGLEMKESEMPGVWPQGGRLCRVWE